MPVLFGDFKWDESSEKMMNEISSKRRQNNPPKDWQDTWYGTGKSNLPRFVYYRLLASKPLSSPSSYYLCSIVSRSDTIFIYLCIVVFFILSILVTLNATLKYIDLFTCNLFITHSVSRFLILKLNVLNLASIKISYSILLCVFGFKLPRTFNIMHKYP